MSTLRNHCPLALAAAWLATRALMLWLLAHDHLAPLGRGGVSREVGQLYFRWYGVLSQGTFPVGDRLWQYPPGAARCCWRPPCCRR